MSAGVMIANVIWKMANRLVGIVPLNVSMEMRGKKDITEIANEGTLLNTITCRTRWCIPLQTRPVT